MARPGEIAINGIDQQRFWSKVDRTGGAAACWPWAAGYFQKGYGAFAVGRKNRTAHRVAYVLTFGDVPDGLTLDHLCRNRSCVNPAHLEPVTAGENVLRGESPSAVNSRKAFCCHGHPLAGRNLYRHPDGSRVCRECVNASQRRATARKNALAR